MTSAQAASMLNTSRIQGQDLIVMHVFMIAMWSQGVMNPLTFIKACFLKWHSNIFKNLSHFRKALMQYIWQISNFVFSPTV